MQPRPRWERYVGFEALAPGGPLGVVVDPGPDGRSAARGTLVVRGGVSAALFYHVPLARIVSVSEGRRVVTVSVESGDFMPRLRDDGSIDLFIR